jgi:hypothetical protein
MDRDCNPLDGCLPPHVSILDCATKPRISVSNELIQRAHVYNLLTAITGLRSCLNQFC